MTLCSSDTQPRERYFIDFTSRKSVLENMSTTGFMCRVAATAATRVGCGGRLRVSSAFGAATDGVPATRSRRSISDLSTERAACPIEKSMHGNEQQSTTG